MHDDESTVLDGAQGASVPFVSGPHLLVHAPKGVRAVPLGPKDSVELGRGSECGVRIDDDKLSRRHLRITRTGPLIEVEDLGSSNGSFVDEVALVGKRAVTHGSRIRAGRTEILVRQPETSLAPGGIVRADPAMAEVWGLVEQVGKTDATLLLLGETGVGKDVFARRVHELSKRSRGPFVRVNCATLSEGLAESQLFGHERGAFTGAEKRRDGFFQAAQGGTLFLDEIGELSLSAQAKVLTAVDARLVSRVGATTTETVDVRYVAATHRDLPAMVEAGTFRRDLWYRLATFVAEIPPLRARPGDVPALVASFSAEIAKAQQRKAPGWSQEAMVILLAHSFPGNVRELRSVVEYAVVLSEGDEVRARHLPAALRRAPTGTALPRATPPVEAPPPARGPAGSDMKAQVEAMERVQIEQALASANGNRTHAAAALGIPRRVLLYKMGKYGIA